MNEKCQKYFILSQSLTSCPHCHPHTHTHLHTHKSATCQAGGQLLKLLIRSVSSSGPEGAGLCKMVRPDTVTSWRLAWASLAGIGPKPRDEWPEHQLDTWLKSWASSTGLLGVWPCVSVILYSTDIRQPGGKSLWIIGRSFHFHTETQSDGEFR